MQDIPQKRVGKGDTREDKEITERTSSLQTLDNRIGITR